MNTKTGVYVGDRLIAGTQKLSFHESGDCRWAETAQYAQAQSRERRPADIVWTRSPLPPKGELGGSHVMDLIVPSNLLSAKYEKDSRPDILWIPAAPRDMATICEFVFTREDRQTIEHAFAKQGSRKLVTFAALDDNTNFFISSHQVSYQFDGLVVPGKNGIRDLIFPKYDSLDTGRPIRLTIFGNREKVADDKKISIVEIGGYVRPNISDLIPPRQN